jgi:hypothetical protein
MPYRAFTGLARAPDLVRAAEAMSKQSQEECLIELKMKMKIHVRDLTIMTW